MSRRKTVTLLFHDAVPVPDVSFQPDPTAAPDGTISVAFHDRRLVCPAAGSAEERAAGLAPDTVNPDPGDCFGTTAGPSAGGLTGYTDHMTSVTTYNDGTNPANRQRQLVSAVAVP